MTNVIIKTIKNIKNIKNMKNIKTITTTATMLAVMAMRQLTVRNQQDKENDTTMKKLAMLRIAAGKFPV